ncbi:MAG: pyridoxamine 5'-phosphate oxidase family protein [Candidatus Omnitrophica bacterium]|nr:pyridoxamine 5'-phosphate oxidase family protein [Candidatus Omnitrophota bacterium]
MNKVFAKISKIARWLTKDDQPVLLSTIGLNGGPRSRYMGAFRIRDTGEIFLISPSNANKIREIRQNPQAQLIFSSKDCKRVLTLSGNALIVRDASLRRTLYEETKPLEIYPVFDDSFGLIRFVPVQAEYLDINISNDPVRIHVSRD